MSLMTFSFQIPVTFSKIFILMNLSVVLYFIFQASNAYSLSNSNTQTFWYAHFNLYYEFLLISTGNNSITSYIIFRYILNGLTYV
jgi:hypothetical protein